MSASWSSAGDHPYLERCIRSCVAQTFPGRSYEVAIFHDGRTPGLTDVIGNYGKRHEITSHLVEADPGAILATVLRKATGRFILFINPEDFHQRLHGPVPDRVSLRTTRPPGR